MTILKVITERKSEFDDQDILHSDKTLTTEDDSSCSTMSSDHQYKD